MDEFFQHYLGNILTIVVILLGGTSFAWSLRSDINLFSQKMSLLHEQNVERLRHVEDELKILREVIINQAKQEERLSIFERRFDKVLGYLKLQNEDE